MKVRSRVGRGLSQCFTIFLGTRMSAKEQREAIFMRFSGLRKFVLFLLHLQCSVASIMPGDPVGTRHCNHCFWDGMRQAIVDLVHFQFHLIVASNFVNVRVV